MRGGWRRLAALAGVWRADLLGLGALALLVFCFLAPALKDGPSLGPADLGRGLSLLTQLSAAAPNHNVVNGDQITQGIPWNTLDWRLVHHGELPLWNPYSGTGMPQLLNFESAVFALPTLVGYLFPLSLAFLVTIGMKLLIAGSGAYVFSRLLGARPLAATLAGATAMLSGGFAGWTGWAVTGPLAWAGWICAAALLAYRRRGVGPVALLALACAFCVYGGFPESYVLLAFALGALLVVAALAGAVVGARPVAAGVGRALAGALAGAALAAPLWLPGIAVLRASARAGKDAASGLPLGAGVMLLTQGYNGLPINGSFWFGPSNYYETAGYLGVVAIVLAAVACVRLWRRPAVVGLALATVATLALVYALPGAPVQHLVRAVGLGAVALQRALPLVGFLVGVLAGLGAEEVCAHGRTAAMRRALLVPSAVLAAVFAVLWAQSAHVAMPPADAPAYARAEPSAATLVALRRASLLWPSATTAALLIGVLAAGVLAARARRRGQGGARRHARAVPGRAPVLAGAALAGVQAAFLLFAGVGLNSYAPASFPETAPLRTLQRLVGSSLLALDAGNVSCAPPALPPACGVRRWMGVGIYPETNIGYGLAELAIHDPTIPQAVFDSWPVPNAGQDIDANLNVFVPSVATAALAAAYGAHDVLVGPHAAPPSGMVKVASIPASTGAAASTMTLYAVPGVQRFSFAAGGDRVLGAHRGGDRSYTLRVAAPAAGTLVAHVTGVAGWRARADGRPVAVRAAGAELTVAVPAGTRTLTLSYWPQRLSAGILLALVAAAGLVATALAGAFRRRRRAGGTRPDEDGRPVAARAASGPLVPSGGG